jgi:hypothetical protein
MMLSVTRVIRKIGEKAFEAMLGTGAFPEVRFSNEGGFKSMSLFDYSNKWSKFMKILDTWMKQEKLDEKLGIFTRKHSADFLAKVTKLANDITVEDMQNQVLRFHTWCDDL